MESDQLSKIQLIIDNLLKDLESALYLKAFKFSSYQILISENAMGETLANRKQCDKFHFSGTFLSHLQTHFLQFACLSLKNHMQSLNTFANCHHSRDFSVKLSLNKFPSNALFRTKVSTVERIKTSSISDFFATFLTQLLSTVGFPNGDT